MSVSKEDFIAVTKDYCIFGAAHYCWGQPAELKVLANKLGWNWMERKCSV